MEFTKKVLIKWLQGIVELIFFIPILLPLFILINPSIPVEYWLMYLAAFYVIGLLTRVILGNQNKWLFLIIGLVIAGTLSIYRLDISLIGILTVILGFFIFYRGRQFWDYEWLAVTPSGYFKYSIGAYFVASLLFTNLPLFKPYLSIFTAFGFISVILYLLVNNMQHLRNISSTGQKKTGVSPAMLRANLVAVAAIAIVISILAFLPAIQRAMSNAVVAVKDFVIAVWMAIYNFLIGLGFEGAEGIPEHIDGTGDGANTIDEPAAWMQMLQDILFYTLLSVVAILLLFFLYKFSKVAYKFIRMLLERLSLLLKRNDEKSLEGTGFVDEKSSVMSLKDLGKSYGDRIQDWLKNKLKKEPKWSDLQNNRERVRFIYRHWLLHRISAGFAFKTSLTPKEAAQALSNWKGIQSDNAELAAAYNEARYSEKDIADEKVSKIKDKMEKPKDRK